MSRMLGTVSRGVRAPIIREGDDLRKIVTQCVLEAAGQQTDGFEIRDRDVICMTEAIVARAQGNYATVQDIAADVQAKFGADTVGIIVGGRLVYENALHADEDLEALFMDVCRKEGGR